MSDVACAPIRVLLVEDDADLCKVMALALRVSGYAVVDADTAEAAIAAIVPADKRVDIVVTDVVLPEMSGVELVRRLCSWRPELKALYISGHGEEILGAYGLKSKEECFLHKPFRLEDLEEKIHKQLHNSSVGDISGPGGGHRRAG